jgi:hypothetical protein
LRPLTPGPRAFQERVYNGRRGTARGE